jgi:hypothetical protein
MEEQMKKLTVTLMIAAFVAVLALPRPAAAGVQFGLKAGGNMAKWTGSDLSDLDGLIKNKVGFVGGLFVAIDMGSVFTIQLEGLYTMKGVQAEYTDVDVTTVEKLYGDYLEFPLLFKVRIPTPIVSPFIFAGPSVGFKLSEKAKVDGEDVPLTETLLKNNDYGAVFGGGVNLGRHFQIDVRYSLGMQKIIQVVEGETQPDVKNGVWSATIGIGF